MRFADIPKLTDPANYKVNVNWEYLESCLERYKEEGPGGLDMDPEFQRGHVWTRAQQIAYVEFKLSGGTGSNEILFNCVGWMRGFEGPFVLVDRKQRLTAALAFLHDEIPAFGYLYSEYEDRMRISRIDFIFCIHNLPDMKSVLKWYLELNSGGTPHTKEELDKVRRMLE